MCPSTRRSAVPRIEAAYQYRGILIRAREGRSAFGLEDNPGHAVVLAQAVEVFGLEVSPSIERTHLISPGLRQSREHADHSAVFDAIGHPGALGDSAKAVLVFSGSSHEEGIESEISVGRSIVTDPDECLYPRIARLDSRPFDVRGRRKQLPLGVEHSGADREKES